MTEPNESVSHVSSPKFKWTDKPKMTDNFIGNIKKKTKFFHKRTETDFSSPSFKGIRSRQFTTKKILSSKKLL